jgi:hypothetical protein
MQYSDAGIAPSCLTSTGTVSDNVEMQCRRSRDRRNEYRTHRALAVAMVVLSALVFTAAVLLLGLDVHFYWQ